MPIFQMFSGSSTMSRTLRRGFSDEIGSWKIIWMLVRTVRMSSPWRDVSSCPPKLIDPLVGRGSCMMARPVVDLPQPDSPTRPMVSPGSTSRLMPETALTLSPVRPTGNSTTRSSTRSSESSRGCRCAVPVPAISPLPPRSAPAGRSTIGSTASVAASAAWASGSARSAVRIPPTPASASRALVAFQTSDPTGYQQAKLWPGVSASTSGGGSVRHRSCTYGQRGLNRQPFGGLIRSGGRPAMARSRVWLGSSSLGMLSRRASV